MNNPIITLKAGLLNFAEELGNLSEASKVMAFHDIRSIATREFIEDGGIDNLINKSRSPPNTKNRVKETTESAVATYTVEQPVMVSTEPVTGCVSPARAPELSEQLEKASVTNYMMSSHLSVPLDFVKLDTRRQRSQ